MKVAAEETSDKTGEVTMKLKKGSVPREFFHQADGDFLWFEEPDDATIAKENYVFYFARKGEQIPAGYQYFGAFKPDKYVLVYRSIQSPLPPTE